jgi:HK97 family phage major capsid protein
MNLQAIREAKASKVAAARALVAKAEGEKRSLTAEESASFDTIKGEITALEADEARAAFLADAERRQSGVVVSQGADSLAALEKRVNVLDAIAAQVDQRSVTGALAEFQQEAKRMGIEPRAGGLLVPSSIFEKRATQTTATSASIVPDDYRPQDFIGLLRNSLIVKQLGARVLTGLRGDTVLPKQTGASTAYWIAEGDTLTESNTSYSSVRLEPKHVGALTALSRQLVQQSNPAIEQLVRDDFSQVVSLAVDKALLHGTAAAKQPVGILNVAGIQTGSLATLDWDAILALLEKLALENITPNAAIMHAKVATKLQGTLKDSVAGAEYLMQGGKLADLPAYSTNQLDAKTGTPSTGRLILGDFTQLVIGEWGATEILANPYAAGYYEKGDIQLRILHTMDAVVRHPKAFVVADDIAL